MQEIFNEIVRDIKGHANQAANNIIPYVGLEFGTISDTGLKLDAFEDEIKDYYVLEYLTMKDDHFTNTTATDHFHEVNTPDQLKPLKEGDRVLVAVVNKVDFAIVGRIASV